MDETPSPSRGKRLEFRPNSAVLIAFNKFMEAEGHGSEAKAIESLAREGLQRRGHLPGPK